MQQPGGALADVRLSAPRLGEHKRFILQDLLGLSEAELEELHSLKVIGDEAQPEVQCPRCTGEHLCHR